MPIPQKNVSIICGIAKNRAIGFKGKLLWHISADLKHFKAITTGHVIMMGEKTYESVGKPLPNRTNVILTKSENYLAEGCIIEHDLEHALQKYSQEEEIFIIGGGQIYKAGLPFASKLYLTVIDKIPEQADTYFPEFVNDFKEIKSEAAEEGELKFRFVELIRN